MLSRDAVMFCSVCGTCLCVHPQLQYEWNRVCVSVVRINILTTDTHSYTHTFHLRASEKYVTVSYWAHTLNESSYLIVGKKVTKCFLNRQTVPVKFNRHFMELFFMWPCSNVKVRVSGVKMTNLRPFPEPAPHGVIPRFIYEEHEGMTGEREREMEKKEVNRNTSRKMDL